MVCCCKGSNERRLECLNGSFGDIHSMVMQLGHLQPAVIFGEKFLDVFRHLIIHDV